MKKSHIIIGLSFLAFGTTLKAQQSFTETVEVSNFETKPVTEIMVQDSAQLAEIANLEEANLLIARLNQINEMDKSNLGFAEKRKLRKEVRSINKSLQAGGGVYISIGAILIILILLIILL